MSLNPDDIVVITCTRVDLVNLIHAYREDPDNISEVIDTLDDPALVGGVECDVDSDGDLCVRLHIRCEGEEVKETIVVLSEDD
jgi:hypothetical protein